MLTFFLIFNRNMVKYFQMEWQKMENFEKLTKQITEMKYLCTENTYRYRPIMRNFYKHYERLEYWLYKEDVYNEVKDIFNDYTLEECERDLETLVEWFSLYKMQDTKNASSIEEFKNKKFRYQLTEYATEIERLTISLEEMEIKTASLEPKLFDRIRIIISNLENSDLTMEQCNDLWNSLNEDFTKLNQNYQDFLKKFNEPKSEELLQSVLFLQFKNEIIKYLREFIKGYQKNINYIKNSIYKIDSNLIDNFFAKLNNYYKKTPIINKNFDFILYEEVNRGKLDNIFKWFIGSNTSISEGEKLMNTTDNIIVKITKYANSLIELRGNMVNRRNEYKHLCKLFDKINDISLAHKYASVIFGIESVKHFIGESNNTDSIINAYDSMVNEILLHSRTKAKKEKKLIVPIVDKSLEKKKLLENYRKQQDQNKQILKNLIKSKKITLIDEINLTKIERRYIQKLLSATNKQESEFGLIYHIIKKDGTCKIVSEDGTFYMNSLEIIFEGDI